MKKLKCLIVDNDPVGLKLLEEYVNKTHFLELIEKCSAAYEAMEIINKYQVDLLFVDIQIPDLKIIGFSGVSESKPRIIFTTTFMESAFIGYKVNALDYLLKPFSYEEFLIVCYKSKEWFQLKANLN
jgi:two-component system LytT family response regulator